MLLGHTLKNIQGHYPPLPDFSVDQVFDLLKFLKEKNLDLAISKRMLSHLYEHPKLDFESILITIGFKEIPENEIKGKVPFLVNKFKETRISKDDDAGKRWVMGNLYKLALGNISLRELAGEVKF